MQGEAAPQCLIYSLLDSCLREARFGPIALDKLVPVFQLNEGTTGIVASSPKSSELFPWLDGPIRTFQQIGNFQGQFWVRRIQNLESERRGHLFSEAILSFQQRAISTGGELERGFELAVRIGRHP